ncbi:PREDICTED: ATP-dependent DNA helicase Q-like 1 [Branchiostoma belcheri]|uniref:DNA 3'-5' helicase n=1 Tax=Branchiostoma belcheri TaxID=7741 RepID=A0A6P4XJY8_BRABE|nr:PREDICTED: ATP-dependent DNA helicase Q-like 1 [Branchiostoma belcheri]
MKEHCEFLNGLGLTAVCLGMDSRDTAGILAGKFQFVLTSPETILGDEKFREMLRSDVYKGHVGLIVIDEAHTVVQWGEASSDEEPFREWFSKLGELRCLIPGTPMLALTATASKKRRRRIQKLLAMQGCKEFIDNPDRHNIKLHVLKVDSSQPLKETFEWLLKLVRSHTEDSKCPRLLLFTKSIDDCTRIYVLCKRYLEKEHMKSVEMYHSQTPESTKCRIRDDMSKLDGSVRVTGLHHCGWNGSELCRCGQCCQLWSTAGD